MQDPLAILLVIAAILLVVDVLFAGGAMTMTGMSAVAGTVAHPVVAGLLLVLVIVLALSFAGAA